MAFVGAGEAVGSFGLLERFLPSARGAHKAARAARLAASAAVADPPEWTAELASHAVLLAIEVVGEEEIREALRTLFS